ncbi:MAG: flavin reductase family protein [Angelakisella sp.]
MSKQVWKGSTLLGPIPPTLVTCGSMEKPNVFTVAWTGIINTIPPKTYISVRPERFSYAMIKASGEFVINLTTEELVRATDFCGCRSGRDTDKFMEMKLTPEPSSELACPTLAESPVSLECRVTDVLELGSHHMFLADIVAVAVDEKLLDASGKLRLDRCHLLAFAHGDYYTLGEKLGSFGYSVRKKPTKAKKKKPSKT